MANPAPSNKGIGEKTWYMIGIGILAAAGVVFAGGPVGVANQVTGKSENDPTPVPTLVVTDPVPTLTVPIEDCSSTDFARFVYDPNTNTYMGQFFDPQTREDRLIFGLTQQDITNYKVSTQCPLPNVSGVWPDAVPIRDTAW